MILLIVKYFGLNKKLYQLLIKYNVRASACENKFILLCANVHASTKIYHNSPDVYTKKYIQKIIFVYRIRIIR